MTTILKRTSMYAVGALLLISACAVDAPFTLAATPTTVSLTFVHGRVNADARFKIHFSSSQLPGGSALYVQRQLGHKHTWTNVDRLSGASGTALVPGVSLGVYEYRISAIRKARVIAASATKSLHSYGNLTLMTLCRALRAACHSGTEMIGATTFAFEDGLDAPGAKYPDYETVLSANHTTCRNASIMFATYTPGRPGEAYLRLVQHESGEAEPWEASTSPTRAATTNIEFNGGPWSLKSSSSDGDNNVMSGTFSCYTPNGL
jgi:hypothetical protein